MTILNKDQKYYIDNIYSKTDTSTISIVISEKNHGGCIIVHGSSDVATILNALNGEVK